jgi:hypothetical protein
MGSRRGFLRALVLGLLHGCSASTSSRGAPYSPNRITREELQALEPLSAFEAIRRLRPHWLQPRGLTSIGEGPTLPRVHLNEARSATLDMLLSVSVSEVEYIEYLSAADATTKHGTGYPGGLIEVRTRR